MITTGILMDVIFTMFGLVPNPNPNIRAEVTHFEINYTFWLNLVFGAVAVYLFVLSARNNMHNHHNHSSHH